MPGIGAMLHNECNMFIDKLRYRWHIHELRAVQTLSLSGAGSTVQIVTLPGQARPAGRAPTSLAAASVRPRGQRKGSPAAPAAAPLMCRWAGRRG